MNIPSAGFLSLATKHHNLQLLNLTQTYVHASTVTQILVANPNLVHLNLFGCGKLDERKPADIGLEKGQLRDLNLGYATTISSTTFKGLFGSLVCAHLTYVTSNYIIERTTPLGVTRSCGSN